ncbi:MAG: hypothetical protein AAGJ55_06310 [Cyanobacteria bacterium J06555_12]
MTTTQTIHCPNCGQAAIRIYGLDRHSGCHCPDNLLTRTECPVCDYVLSTCTLSGSVVEAYAPGIQLMSNRRRAIGERYSPPSSSHIP